MTGLNTVPFIGHHLPGLLSIISDRASDRIVPFIGQVIHGIFTYQMIDRLQFMLYIIIVK